MLIPQLFCPKYMRKCPICFDEINVLDCLIKQFNHILSISPVFSYFSFLLFVSFFYPHPTSTMSSPSNSTIFSSSISISIVHHFLVLSLFAISILRAYFSYYSPCVLNVDILLLRYVQVICLLPTHGVLQSLMTLWDFQYL
jgi:hypothetical protein